jgi:hypothetical protein
MRGQRGQGTVEYVGIIFVVAVLIAVGASTALGAGPRDIWSAVRREIHRALCIVTGGDCDQDRAPCPVASKSDSTEWSVSILVVKGGQEKTVLRELRSDGTVAVTVTDAKLGGLDTGVGVEAHLSTGRKSLGIGGALRASILAELGGGRTWVMPNRAAAEGLVGRLKDDLPVPPPDQELDEKGLRFGVEGEASRGGARGTVEVAATGKYGTLTDRATGRRTIFLDGGVEGDADASLRGRVKGAVAGDDSERYALTLGPDGRWIDLAVLRTGELRGSGELPVKLRAARKTLRVRDGGRWVTETHLDLSDAENLVAAQGLVAKLRAFPPDPIGLARAMAGAHRRLDERGVVNARTYSVDHQEFGGGGHVAAELKLGGEYVRTVEHTRLLSAATRGIDGEWRERADCERADRKL